MSDIPAFLNAPVDEAPDIDPEVEARRAGYSWPEINAHIADSTAKALSVGYTPAEIDQHLGRPDPTAFQDRARATWAGAQAADPKLLDTADLTASPTFRSDYATALLNGEVRGPQDFADNYAVASLEAAHDIHGVDDSSMQGVRAKQSQAAAAADAASPQLPTREDLIDASVSLTGQYGDEDQVRTNLMNHWLDTGQDPASAAMQAQVDPALENKLLSPFGQGHSEVPTTIEQLSSPARDAIEKFYFVPGEELPDAKTVGDAFTDLGIDIATVAGLNLAGKYIVAPLARAAMRELGELPKWLGNLAETTTTDSVDMAKPPGMANNEVSVADTLKPVEPARMEPAPVVEGAPPKPDVFVEGSTPAAQLETLARDNAETASSPTTFRDLAAEQDPETQALAAGADHTAAFGSWTKTVFGDLLGDESGAILIPPVVRSEKIEAKNYADELIRKVSTGLGTQRSENVAQGFEQFFKDLAPFMPRWKQEIAKGPGGDPMGTEVGRVVNAIEGKGVVEADNQMAPYVRFRSEQNDAIKAQLDAAIAKGDLDPIQYRENYLAHLYTPESIGKVGGAGGGRTGSLGFTKERTHATYEDALTSGLKPLYDNPILMDLASIDTKLKTLATVEMQGIARDAGYMKYYTDPRAAAADGMKKLTGLNSEKSVSTVNPDGTPGPVIHHQLYGKDGFDKIWNNWVGWEGMQRNATVATIEDAMLKMKNASTYFKLLFPGFHTITEYKNGMASGVANALTELQGGELARGAWDLAISPIKPLEYIYKSATKWRPMYRAMEADPALDAFVAGGGGLAGRSKVYSATDSPTIWKMWTRGGLTQEIGEGLTKMLTLPRTRAGEGVKGFAGDVTNLPMVPLRAAANAVSSATAPIWDHMIPLLKSGAAIERLQTFIRQNPTASEAAMSRFQRQVVTNIEDRMGEYNTANLFWPTAVKRAANQSMLSTTWTYGTVDATLRAFGYAPGRGLVWDHVATTNLMGQLATVAFTNAAWTLLATGALPTSTLDYMIPFANARGLARLILPGEEKEYYDWWKIVASTYAVYQDKGMGAAFQQLAQSGTEYAKGKLAPVWQAALAIVTGSDAIGHKIAYTPGGMAKFLTDQFMPIFFQSWDKSKALGLNPVESMFGLREAPKAMTDFSGFLDQQTKLHTRWTTEELARARKEALAVGAEPPEGGSVSARGGASAPRVSNRAGGFVQQPSPRQNPSFYGYAPQPQQPAAGRPSVEQAAAGPMILRGAGRRPTTRRRAR
jgi:hypothetical protein